MLHHFQNCLQLSTQLRLDNGFRITAGGSGQGVTSASRCRSSRCLSHSLSLSLANFSLVREAKAAFLLIRRFNSESLRKRDCKGERSFLSRSRTSRANLATGTQTSRSEQEWYGPSLCVPSFLLLLRWRI